MFFRIFGKALHLAVWYYNATADVVKVAYKCRFNYIIYETKIECQACCLLNKHL